MKRQNQAVSRFTRGLAALLAGMLCLLALMGCARTGDDDEPGEIILTGGYWVLPEDYVPEGLSMIDYFSVSDDLSTCTVYNLYGEKVNTLDCQLEGNLFTIDVGFGPASFLYTDGQLLDPDDGQVEFVFTTESPFRTENLNFDGRWFQAGDREAIVYYEIEGKQFRKMRVLNGEPVVEREGTYQYENVQQSVGSYRIPDLLKLGTGHFEPELVPSEDRSMLFEVDGFDCRLFVREDRIDDAMTDTYRFMDQHMSGTWSTGAQGNSLKHLKFHPYCVSLSRLEDKGEGMYESVEEIYGQWAFDGPRTLILRFEDGTEETVFLPADEEGTLHVEKVNGDFRPEPTF